MNQKAAAAAHGGVAGAGSKTADGLERPAGRNLVSQLLSCKFFVAFALFALISGVCGKLALGRLQPDDFPYSTWTACAIRDFLKAPEEHPKIAFVGSSLMLVPLGGADCDYMNVPVDLPHHHDCVYVQSAWKKLTGQSVRSFNFALPGEMPSDAYLIANFLMKGKKKPDVLVYGVGPRDFLDNLLPSPGATDPYQYLSRFGDVSGRIDLIAPGWQERLNYELGQLFYGYGNKSDLSLQFARTAEAVVDRLLPAKPISIAERRQLLPDYRQFEVGENDCMYRPTTAANPPHFSDNIGEYKKRYKEMKWDTYLSQMRFMADILNIARDRGVHVVIVSMPITDINKELLSDLAWNAYQHSLKVLAQAKGADFIDMQGTGKFKLSDFGDTVHLHSWGGRKLLDLVVGQMSETKGVRTAMKLGDQKKSKDKNKTEVEPQIAAAKGNPL